MPIMEEKSVILVTGKHFPELLHGPFRSRMFGHVAVNETSGSDLKSDEHIEDREAGCDGDKKSQATIPCAWLRTNVDQR